uniref:Uncharacterized protein n=1 Tax=Rhizophora mucronata TaxID=61149 RepID=A0A2P2NGD8_RHIMU
MRLSLVSTKFKLPGRNSTPQTVNESIERCK